MIKVVVKSRELSAHPDNYEVFDEMMEWCRKTFGKNKRKQPFIWTTRIHYEPSADYDSEYAWNYYPAFFFSKQEHANWFIMRWL